MKPIKKQTNSCYVLETVLLIPRVVDFLVYFYKYAPLTLGLDNSSCEPDEYTDFDVFQTPPNNARGTMHALHELLGFHISFEKLGNAKNIWCSGYVLLWYSK